MKINILNSSIYNRISAGEVVERPSSVVKELVENSIDAGATDIIISIKDGGVSYINIQDNGIGIENGEIKKAFVPHATSKIENIEDLDSISTLGFRGEALASIANVCMVTLKSRSNKDEAGKVIEINGGEIACEYECGMNIGTDITVENLFFNTPARKKFLKSSKAEEKYVSNLVTRLIMCNPQIAFTYVADDKKIFQTYGDGLKKALDEIYSLDTTKNLIEIENTFGNFRLNGFIGDYSYSKPNKTYQTVIINGRFVQNTTVSTAVATAYGEKLMKRTYPFFVLDIIMPFDLVDVNVHPAKTEVRFVDERKIFSFVYHSVQACLINNEMRNNDFSGFKIGNEDTNISISNDIGEQVPVASNPKKQTLDLTSFSLLQNDASSSLHSSYSIFDKNTTVNSENKEYFYTEKEKISEPATADFKSERTLLDYFDQSENSEIAYKQEANDENIDKSLRKASASDAFTGKIIGQLFDTYILIENNNEFYLIDQHAVHERIIYDDLCKNEDIELQNLLIPYVFDTNFTESEFLQDNITALNELGIGIEHFGGNSFKISYIPLSMVNNDLDEFVKELLKNVSAMKSITSIDLLKEKLKQTACKSAIKAGYGFNKEQQEALVRYFIENGMPLKCPHGRPTTVKLTKQEIEKMFKRIV